MATSTAKAAFQGIIAALAVVTKRFFLFVGGLIAGALLAFSLQSSTGIPPGKYTPLKIYGGMSVQINLDSIESDSANGIYSLWVREDREGPFLTETGLMGRSVFSKITIDCNKKMITVLEQRAFDMNMKLVASKTGSSKSLPNSMMTTVMIMTVCGKLAELEPAPSDSDSDSTGG